MDANKLKKLKEIEYTIKRCCGNCVSSEFQPLADWGVCLDNEYRHQKHEGGEKTKVRKLSINKYGFCEAHEYRVSFDYDVAHFQMFVEK